MNLHILQPESIEEAVEALAEYGDEAKVVAGGTALTVMLRQGYIRPSVLVSLGRVKDPSLRAIRHDTSTGLRFGAMATIRECELSALVRQHSPMLAEAFGTVANVRVRNAATIGGNLAEADYASDPPAPLTVMQGRVQVTGRYGNREVAIGRFFGDFYTTCLEPEEIITEVIAPPLPRASGSAYVKYVSRSSEDRPCAGAAAVVAVDEDGRCLQLRIVVSAVAETPQECPLVESAAEGRVLTPKVIDEVANGYAEAIDPLTDLRGSRWYRQRVVGVIVRRAVASALSRSEGFPSEMVQADQGTTARRS